jgi:hypothetical protein
MYRFAILLFLIASTAQALPPLGLTQVAATDDSTSQLVVIDGVAYVSHHTGVSLVDTTGLAETIIPQNAVFLNPSQPTRAVLGDDGEVYVGINYDAGGTIATGGASLFRLSEPTQAVASWEGLFALGFDSQRNGMGATGDIPSESAVWSRLHPNETTSPVPASWFETRSVLPSGLVAGNASVAGTIGSAGATLDAADNIDFIDSFGSLWGARERADGDGINVGYDLGAANVVYFGSRGSTFIDGVSPSTSYRGVMVSETDFTLLSQWDGDYSVFFPGVNPAGDDLSVPLLSYFPDLSAVNFDAVTDIASADGQVHLLLSGDDGLWVYSAVDPTWVPEPTTALLAIVALIGPALRRRA